MKINTLNWKHTPQQTWASQAWKRCRSPAVSSHSVGTGPLPHGAPRTWTHWPQAWCGGREREMRQTVKTAIVCTYTSPEKLLLAELLYSNSAAYLPICKYFVAVFLIGLTSQAVQTVFIVENPKPFLWAIVKHDRFYKKGEQSRFSYGW